MREKKNPRQLHKNLIERLQIKKELRLTLKINNLSQFLWFFLRKIMLAYMQGSYKIVKTSFSGSNKKIEHNKKQRSSKIFQIESP